MNNLKKKFQSFPFIIQEVLKYVFCCLFVLTCGGFVIGAIALAMINPAIAVIEFCLSLGAAVYIGTKD